jgi:hypothetical protein
MKTKVITAVAKSEKAFFERSIFSQEEWAKDMNYDYAIYQDFSVSKSSLSWAKIIAFYTSLKNSEENQRIILFFPNVFIMESINPFSFPEEKISTIGDENLFHVDFLSAISNPKILKVLEFLLGFSSIDPAPEKALHMAIEIFPDVFQLFPRKGLIGFYGVNPFSLDVKAVSWKEQEPGTKIIGEDTQREYLYEVGDFGVNLSQNKYIVKELSKDFYNLKKRFHEELTDSRKIYEDVKRSRR